MSLSRFIPPWSVFFILGIAATLLTPYAIRSAKIDHLHRLSQTLTQRMIFDVREFNWYREEGTWFREGFLPYRDRPYEYPVFATALFTLPALVAHDVFSYHILFRLSVVGLGCLLIWRMGKELQQHNKSAFAWLLLAPSVWYFTMNRFDIVPALLLQISLWLLLRQQWRWSYFLLACSFLFKWYAGLLLPLYALYMFDHARDRSARSRGFAGMLLFVGTLVAGHVWIFLFGGNILDMVNPYAIHFVRSPEIGSLVSALLAPFGYHFISSYAMDAGQGDALVGVSVALSSMFQLSGIAFVVLWWLRTDTRAFSISRYVMHLAFIVVGAFVLFNRVYSFQWIVWLAPLFIASMPDRRSIIIFLCFDLVNYIQFPVLYGTFIDEKLFVLFTLLTLARSFLLGWLLARAIRQLPFSTVSSPRVTSAGVATPMETA